MRRQLGSDPARQSGIDPGFTLIEVVIAMTIFAIIAASTLAVILQTQSTGVSNRSRIAAANLASRELDLVRQEFNASTTGPTDIADEGVVVNANPLTGGTAGEPLVVDGTAYTVTRSASWNLTGTGESTCSGGTLVKYPTLHVVVSVTWPSMGSVEPVVQVANLAPAKKVGISETASFIAVAVTDNTAAPLAGVQVTAAGPSTASAVTDTTGCAVIEVTPAATTGSTYAISVTSSGYVDISGSTSPTKSSGVLLQGNLFTGVSFQVARPGSVVLQLVANGGGTLTDEMVSGSTVTLVASEFAGSSGETARTVTGLTSTVTDLWPTSYGAYLGTSAPVDGYATQELAAGGSITLDVGVDVANVSLANLPTGTTAVRAVPTGTACSTTAGVAANVSGTGGSLTVLPGSYDLYAWGTGFSCSPGPSAVDLSTGSNGTVTWATSTLTLVNAPAGSTLWALNVAASGLTTLTSCPTTMDALAIDVTAGASGGATLPAGSYFLWATSGTTASSTCVNVPDGLPVTIAYGASQSFSWPVSVSLTLTGVPTNGRFAVWTGTTCPTTSQATWVVSSANQSTLVQTVTAPSSGTVTYTAWARSKSNGTCYRQGYFQVASTTAGPLTLPYVTSNKTTTVGP